MKKIIFNLLILTFSFSALLAQNIPQGMSYQAVARDADGQLLSNVPISLKISLISNIERHGIAYSEIHKVKTNEYGLFNFVIGQGESSDGSFEEIPWESEEIWLEVAMDAKAGEDYKVMNTTKLLTVPYAFHAGSANELVPINPEDGRVPWWGQPWWNIQGLEKTNPDKHFVGNIDSVDLVFRTNNIEWQRIKADGNIVQHRNVEIGENLYVTDTTFTRVLKTEELIVSANKPDEGQGGYVATFENTNDDKGDGIKIKLGKNRPVGPEIGPDIPIFIGPLLGVVDKTHDVVDAILEPNQDNLLDLFSPYLDPSAVFATGEQYDFYYGTLCFMSQGILNAGLQGINDGLGLPWTDRDIAIALNGHDPVLCALKEGIEFDSLEVPFSEWVAPYNTSTFKDELLIEADSVECPDCWDNAVWCEALDGLIDDSDLSYDVKWNTFIPEIPEIELCQALEFENYFLPAFPSLDDSSSLNMTNEFISFVDRNDNLAGAIKGISTYDFANSYIDDFLILDVAAEVIGVDPLAAMAQGVNQVAKLSKKYNELGVEYSSGHGDYAEWLERENPNERISTGDIVAVKGGKITKDLTGAEQIMAVSFRPIVLGNIPIEGKEHLGNNIAFMGQIPVKVMGPIESGDYIIANPEVPGYGIGLSEEEMTIADLKLAVGRSWESNLANGPKMVNTVIGVPSGDYVKFLESYEQKMLNTEARMEAVESKLEMLSELISKEGRTN